ncbi:MAG: polysaccharide deacetylase family protein [Solirubrobacteraceae bacterium]
MTALHRRRRSAALALTAAIALTFGIVVGGSSSDGRRRAPVSHPSPSSWLARIATLAGSGRGSLAVDERVAERRAIQHTLSYTPYVRVAGSQHRELALTFDDGPGPYTPQIVAELAKLKVPATFFEVGIEERYFHAGTTEIVAHGWPIGDHTDTHPPMSTLSRGDQQRQLLQEASAIGEYGAPFPDMFRPPYGVWNRTTLALLRADRMLMILWTVDTSDYTLPGTQAIVQRAVDGARPGAIILMHDAGGDRSETVAALPKIVRDLRARGYRLVTVPQLLLDNPAPRDQNTAGLGSGG